MCVDRRPSCSSSARIGFGWLLTAAAPAAPPCLPVCRCCCPVEAEICLFGSTFVGSEDVEN